jgi:hypothetical protein
MITVGVLSTENRIVALIICGCLILVTINLTRKSKLSEQYAVIWIIAEFAMLILVISDPISRAIMRLVGATNLSSTLFLLGFLMVMSILLDLSTKVAGLSNKLRCVTQELGLLREQFERLNEKDEKAK